MKRLSLTILILTLAIITGSLAAAALTNISFDREISAGRVLSDGDSLTAVRFDAMAGYEDFLVYATTGEVSFNLRSALHEMGSQGGFNGGALFSIGSENHEMFSVTNHSDLPVQLLMIDTTGGLSLQGSPEVLSPGVTGYYYYTIDTAGIDPETPIGGTLRVSSDLTQTTDPPVIPDLPVLPEPPETPEQPVSPPEPTFQSGNLADLNLEAALYDANDWTSSDQGIQSDNPFYGDALFYHPNPLEEYSIRLVATLDSIGDYGGYGLLFESTLTSSLFGFQRDNGYVLQFDRGQETVTISRRVSSRDANELKDVLNNVASDFIPEKEDEDWWNASHEIILTVRKGASPGTKSIDIHLDGTLITHDYLLDSDVAASDNLVGLVTYDVQTHFEWLSADSLD